jgi:magnesium-transporting ATPase (P-type)
VPRAGIRVKMITGDHAGTPPRSRGRSVCEPRRVLTGADLDAMDDAALAAAVLETAMSSPAPAPSTSCAW